MEKNCVGGILELLEAFLAFPVARQVLSTMVGRGGVGRHFYPQTMGVLYESCFAGARDGDSALWLDLR